MRIDRVMILILSVLAVTACAARGGGANLEGSNWILTSLNGVGLVPGSSITAAFGDDGRLSGSSGCNRYSASYEVSGSSLTIGQAMSTLMACEEALMAQESAYLAALASTAGYVMTADQLTLRDASGSSLLVFKAQSTDLQGTSWIVTGYNNGKEAVVSVLAGTEMTAAFGADGMLSGNAGCNSYNASFTTDGESITISPAASTRMFCGEPDGVMDQEAQFLAALATAGRYSMSGPRLEQRTADGALAASFDAAQQ
jgi:heat shock protein HslJ